MLPHKTSRPIYRSTHGNDPTQFPNRSEETKQSGGQFMRQCSARLSSNRQRAARNIPAGFQCPQAGNHFWLRQEQTNETGPVNFTQRVSTRPPCGLADAYRASRCPQAGRRQHTRVSPAGVSPATCAERRPTHQRLILVPGEGPKY